MNFTGLKNLRESLESSGWRVEINNLRDRTNDCNWYAWSTNRHGITPDCACNDKPPSLVVYPHEFILNDIHHESVGLSITGEAHGGEWVKIEAYSMKPSEFIEKYPAVRRRLVSAWAAFAKDES